MTAIPVRTRLLTLVLFAALALGGGLAAGIALRPGGAEFGLRARPQAVIPPALNTPAVRYAASLSDAFITIAETVTPAVVRIEVERYLPAMPASLLPRTLEDNFARPQGGDGLVPQIDGGSGFIVSSDGYILTNDHVVATADRIAVTLRDRRTLEARVVGRDPTTDVAVIKVEATGLPTVALGDSDAARVGEWVLAIGNPGMDDVSTLDFTVTSGIISAKGRPLNILGADLYATDPSSASYAIEDFIQTDAVINPGNSGGPLVDLRGAVIGINTAIATTTGSYQGYSFAIPSNLAQRVMRDLIEHGYVRRALLGISIADIAAEDAEVYHLPRIAGVVIEDFADDSPARAAGLRRHDVVVAVDGVPVERVGQLQRLVAQHQPGEQVALSVVRYGERLEVAIPLSEAAPAGLGASEPRALPATLPTGLGLELSELGPREARILGYAMPGGALITRVTPASAASRKYIGEGHRVVEIDGQAITSAAQARTLLAAARSGQVVSLLIAYPDARTYVANVRVP